MNGTIFDIKEFSIHDGPGSRITVFLKGCPLRCRWCHNPEGLKAEPQLMFKKNFCTDCKKCFEPCSHSECKPFNRCIHACMNGCLSVAGEVISAKELAKKLLENADFFEMTGGGVTVSGGEPMMQADFVCELADELKGVHKAIQTSGYADFETYKKVISKFDYIMQDIKLANCDEHRLYTCVGNEKILKNIEWLKESGKEFIFRVPLIPGITETEENLKAISQIAGDFPVELLKYNVLAGAKYEMLGAEYPLGDLENKNTDYTKYFKNAYMKH
ncbi:MAG: glycyl-radical enzyme activating protein [Clostridia bacterium]|nr:glycyl-radical enzyme activating protein [Clostridia bacterium]